MVCRMVHVKLERVAHEVITVGFLSQISKQKDGWIFPKWGKQDKVCGLWQSFSDLKNKPGDKDLSDKMSSHWSHWASLNPASVLQLVYGLSNLCESACKKKNSLLLYTWKNPINLNYFNSLTILFWQTAETTDPHLLFLWTLRLDKVEMLKVPTCSISLLHSFWFLHPHSWVGGNTHQSCSAFQPVTRHHFYKSEM